MAKLNQWTKPCQIYELNEFYTLYFPCLRLRVDQESNLITIQKTCLVPNMATLFLFLVFGEYSN
jgi:hypothetical protein